MDDLSYREWWPLHLRVAKGDVLSDEEQARYDEGLRNVRADEVPLTSLARLRKTREEICVLEAERERHEEERQRLRKRVAELEVALSENAKYAIGVVG